MAVPQPRPLLEAILTYGKRHSWHEYSELKIVSLGKQTFGVMGRKAEWLCCIIAAPFRARCDLMSARLGGFGEALQVLELSASDQTHFLPLGEVFVVPQ